MVGFDNRKAMQAYEREQARKYLNDNTLDGSLARALSLHHAFRQWFADEMKRRDDAADVHEAAALVIARLMGDVLINIAHGDRKLALETAAPPFFDTVLNHLIDHLGQVAAHQFTDDAKP